MGTRGRRGAPRRVRSCSTLPRRSASTRALAPTPKTPFPHAQALPCLAFSRWASLPRRRRGSCRRRAPDAPGRTVCSWAHRQGRPRVGEGWSCAAAALLLLPPLPLPGAPRPGRLCPMSSGVAGRWGVFLFWVEVEAEERAELATCSRCGRWRHGRWWRPSRSREVSRSRPTAPASPVRHPVPVPELPGLSWAPGLCTPLAAEPGPGRTRRPHEEGRERSNQEQI